MLFDIVAALLCFVTLLRLCQALMMLHLSIIKINVFILIVFVNIFCKMNFHFLSALGSA